MIQGEELSAVTAPVVNASDHSKRWSWCYSYFVWLHDESCLVLSVRVALWSPYFGKRGLVFVLLVVFFFFILHALIFVLFLFLLVSGCYRGFYSCLAFWSPLPWRESLSMCLSCICLFILLSFSLPLGVMGWLQLVTVALPGLSY